MAISRRELIYRDGKPAAVILDIREYEELLERLEDAEDLRELRRIRAGRPRFRKLSDFLSSRARHPGRTSRQRAQSAKSQ